MVLDGEALAVDPTGRARPFQETSGRAARLAPGALIPFFFDALHLDGDDLVDEPGSARWAALDRAVPDAMRVARTLVDSPEAASAAFAEALAPRPGGRGGQGGRLAPTTSAGAARPG